MKNYLYLVAVDGSEWGERAAACAVRQAKQTGAKVLFLTAIPWSGFQPLTMDEIAHRPIDKKVEEESARTTVLEPLIEKHKDSGVTLSTEMHWGDPADIIHERTKKLHANQVFIGRRGRSRLADLILGSVANTVAHKTGVPLTLVP